MNARSSLDAFDGQLGAFARIFPRSSATLLADAFVDNGLKQMQLNLSALGLPTIPTAAELEHIDLARIQADIAARDLRIWGVSVTYNIAHPDTQVRTRSNEEAAHFIRELNRTRANAATLSTGTRSRESTWTHHPDNTGHSAWHDMRASLDVLLSAAADAGILLAIEPEPGNIISDSRQAVRLLKELGNDADHIGFILDPANLVATHPRAAHADVLREAFTALGERTICVHAKDTVPWADTLAGHGVVDYDVVLALRASLPEVVPLIIQDATEGQVPLLRERLREAVLATS